MHVKAIKLKNFRNYENLKLEFSKDFNIIFGDNAQGKTNILEAIFICAAGRSHRTSRDQDLIRFTDNGYYIHLDLEKEKNDSTIEVYYSKDEKKKIKINEIPLKKIGNLYGYLNTVIFSPEDLMIIKEGPSERRRFIDITLSQIKPSYFYDLQQYMKILQQKNRLLKEIQNNRSLLDTLDIWNLNLASVGSRIMKIRKEFIQRLNGVAEEKHYNLTDGKEKLAVEYNPSFSVKNYDDIYNEFLHVIETSKGREIQKANTLLGPQRDDYDILLNENSLKIFGSQGQQRTAVLSIKLSEIDIMKELTGENPVLLLDDVMSELDGKRQQYLFHYLKEVQTFITCTDRNFFSKNTLFMTNFYQVEKGVVNRI